MRGAITRSEPTTGRCASRTPRARCWSPADFAPLVDYEALGRDAMLSVPTPDHYLPLLYVLAQHRAGDEVTFPVEGFDGGSISMLTVAIG